MTRRLARRLLVIVGVGLGVGVAVPCALLVDARGDARETVRDERLARVAFNTLFQTPVRFRGAGSIDVRSYTETPRAPDAPLTAILNRRGEPIAFDRRVPPELRPIALRAARRGDDDPATVATAGGDVRVVVQSLEARPGSIGSVIAYEPVSRIASERRDDVLLIGAVALGGWLLLMGASAALIGRTLGPAATAVARQEAFLADAAHELRTPLAVVRGRAERALRDGAGREDLQAIATAAAGAAQTITEMLELARLDAGLAVGERESMRLDSLVATCVTDLGEAPGVEVRVAPGEPVIVEGDERLLGRAIANLLTNAVRHGGAGGVVEVIVDREGGHGRVRVSDHGPGIAPGQREHVFERFHRGSSTASGGAGLGLAIARLIAEAHGGRVVLEPPDPARPGATFTLTVRATG